MPPRHVYVHVPFCARRCSYCDFSIAVRTHVPVDEYLTALAGELTLRLGPMDAGAERARIETFYFGGGTPSRLGGPTASRGPSRCCASGSCSSRARRSRSRPIRTT